MSSATKPFDLRDPSEGSGPGATADQYERSLHHLRLVVAGDESLGRALHRIAVEAAEVLDGVDEASVTISRERAALTAAFSGPTSAALDERQYESDAGPCLEACRTGRRVLVPSVQPGDAGPFDGFAREARRTSVRSVAALPLRPAGTVRGALNLYTVGEVPLGGDELTRAEAFATTAAAALAAAVTYAAAVEDAANARAMMESRAVIEQAKGVLMARFGIDAETAFARLRETSQHSNRKLRDLAAEVVAEASDPKRPSSSS